MTDAATSLAAGAVTFPFLAAIGIDPASIAAGLAGCVIVQTLLPSDQQSVTKTALLTIGSVLFASLATPFALPVAVSYVVEHYPKSTISVDAVKPAVAALLGGFAQPLMFLLRAVLRARAARQTETPNA